VDLLFNLLGSFFYFWPLTSSKNYTTGGFKDFEFLSLDRYNSNMRFNYDYCIRRLRVSGKLGLVTFDVAFGAEGQSELMIQALSESYVMIFHSLTRRQGLNTLLFQWNVTLVLTLL